MSDPAALIKTPNQAAAMRRHLAGQLPELKAIPGLVGVTLNGGLSRGYADHLSEIDLVLYLDPATYRAWQHGPAPLASGITKRAGMLYDIKVVDYEAERARAWDDLARWDAAYAEILHDPQGAIGELLTEKLAAQPDPAIAEGLMMDCWWHFRLATDIWLHRGDPWQGQLLLNQALTALLKALFPANRQYIPHEKWLLHLSRSLDWTPSDWESRLGQALQSGDLSSESLKQRQAVIEELWREVDAYLIERYFPGLPVHIMQKSTYEHLKLLADRGTMPLAAWQTLTGRDVPHSDPFQPLLRIEGETISLDRAELNRIQAEDMYVWHYEVLCAVREGK